MGINTFLSIRHASGMRRNLFHLNQRRHRGHTYAKFAFDAVNLRTHITKDALVISNQLLSFLLSFFMVRLRRKLISYFKVHALKGTAANRRESVQSLLI